MHNWLLIGTNQGKGIYRAAWNPATGAVGAPELAVETPQPTFLTLHPHLLVVYACNESDVPQAAVSAFSVEHDTASLKPFSTGLTQGGAPCFVTADHTGKLLFAANYGGGSLSVFALGEHGEIGPSAVDVFHCAANADCGARGPVKDRQDAPHLHCAVVSPDNRFVLTCDLGSDSILTFPIVPGSVKPLGRPIRLATAPGAGPRHLAFHPNGRWLYCINEIDCTVVLYRWKPQAHPPLQPEHDGTVSIRSPERPDVAPSAVTSTGAEVALTRDGQFAYTSTRFSNVLTVFGVHAGSGRLTQVQQIPCAGDTPRFFALDGSERWLLCANQDSNSISVFARDPLTGILTHQSSHPAPNPECLLWV